MFLTGDGQKTTLNPISSISFGDTSTYNLSNARLATQTMDHLESLMESIASIRATVGSNMEVTKNNLNSLYSRNTSLQQSISRTQDTSFAEETAELAKTAVMLQLNLSMSLQARSVSRDVTLTLLQ